MSARTGLDEFFDVLSGVKKIALIAAGGLLVLPLVAGLGGYIPPWPTGIIGITSLVELVVLILVFQTLSRAKRTQATKVVIWASVFVFVFSAIYLILHSVFVYSIPNNASNVVLGCGLSEKSEIILASLNRHPKDVCPGEFSSLLASAQYNTDVVWSKLSVSLIKAALAISWLASFGALAALVGVFVSYQRSQNIKPKP